ncbi:hypothetical protein DBR06_SOUSAS1410045, partial [Sousa chinensis]
VHYLEVAHVDSPVRVLRLRHELHQVARPALVEQVLGRVGAQRRGARREAFLVDALVAVEHGALHLVQPRVIGLRRGQRQPVPAVRQTAATAIRPLGRRLRLHVLVVIGEDVGDPDAGPVVPVHARRVGITPETPPYQSLRKPARTPQRGPGRTDFLPKVTEENFVLGQLEKCFRLEVLPE